jgi:hypothetical protein
VPETSQPIQPLARQDQTQQMEEYATEDAKTMVVEKIQCTNQFEEKYWKLIVKYLGMDPQTLASTYLEGNEIEDLLHKLHNDLRIKHFFYSPRMDTIEMYEEQVALINYLESKVRQSKQGFMTRQVTGPAIRSATTSTQQGDVQKKGWLRGRLF